MDDTNFSVFCTTVEQVKKKTSDAVAYIGEATLDFNDSALVLSLACSLVDHIHQLLVDFVGFCQIVVVVVLCGRCFENFLEQRSITENTRFDFLVTLIRSGYLQMR